MSQRLSDSMKWAWCLLALYSAPLWTPAASVTVKAPPNVPATIEAQAKFFQDFFSVQLSPYKIEFGHVCEDPNTWEQRYEAKDFKNHRAMGKVRWGDKQGGYGEHYWDLNHAGHAGNQGDDHYGGDSDDGSYKVHDDDPYDEPSEQKASYESDYDPEKSSYEDTNRAKRAHPKTKVEKNEEEDEFEDIPKIKPKRKVEVTADAETARQERPKRKQRRQRPVKEQIYEEEEQASPPDTQEQPSLYVRSQAQVQPSPTPAHYVPYEGGAGVRQHQHAEATAAASAPRLFLEPSTGHVVDRATGQAYLLQPVANNYN